MLIIYLRLVNEFTLTRQRFQLDTMMCLEEVTYISLTQSDDEATSDPNGDLNGNKGSGRIHQANLVERKLKIRNLLQAVRMKFRPSRPLFLTEIAMRFNRDRYESTDRRIARSSLPRAISATSTWIERSGASPFVLFWVSSLASSDEVDPSGYIDRFTDNVTCFV